jgi:nuclear GTP-binding protein
VLRDWNSGKLVRYTVPPSGEKSGSLQTVDLGEMDKEVLDCVRSRKEMRRSGGLVRLLASGVENREVDLEKPWFWFGMEEEGGSDDEDEDEDEGGGEADGDGGDDEMMLDGEEDEEEEDDDGSSDGDEDDDDDQQEEEPELPPAQKRKQAVSFGSGRPLTKKVAFASATRTLIKEQEQRQQRPGQPGLKMKSILKKTKKRGKV